MSEILYATMNEPESWHDAHVAKKLYFKLLHETPFGYYLVADTAFPRTAASIGGCIQMPRKANKPLPQERAACRQAERVNCQHLSY